jgi:hypothetical protein
VIKFRQNLFKQEVKYYVLIKSIWNKEELPDHRKESITVSVHKKGDNIDCSNNRGISMLSTSYKMLANILSSRLSTIIGDHQCGFRRNRSTTDLFFFIRQILEKSGSKLDSTVGLQSLHPRDNALSMPRG